MKTHATVTGPKGPVKLTFGVYGLKNFTRRMGCAPEMYSILAAFQGGTKLGAMAEIIRSGVEQHCVDTTGTLEPFTDYDACEVLETCTEAEGEKAMKAFFSSIVGKDYDEWYKELTAEIEKAEAQTDAAQTEADEKKTEATTPQEPGTKLRLKRSAR